jgi:hypothetical protein
LLFKIGVSNENLKLMNLLMKVMLSASLMSILGLGGLATAASIKSFQANSVIPQRSNPTQVAEASDGDGEMNDALEAEQEKRTSQGNAPTETAASAKANNVNQNQKISEDKNDRDGGNEAQEDPNEPNDRDGGNEAQETH